MNWQLFDASANVHFKRMLAIFVVSWILAQVGLMWYFGFHLHIYFRRNLMLAVILALIPCAIYLAIVWVWNNFLARKV